MSLAIFSVTSRGAPGSSGVPITSVGAVISGRRGVVPSMHMAAEAASNAAGVKAAIAFFHIEVSGDPALPRRRL